MNARGIFIIVAISYAREINIYSVTGASNGSSSVPRAVKIRYRASLRRVGVGQLLHQRSSIVGRIAEENGPVEHHI